MFGCENVCERSKSCRYKCDWHLSRGLQRRWQVATRWSINGKHSTAKLVKYAVWCHTDLLYLCICYCEFNMCTVLKAPWVRQECEAFCSYNNLSSCGAAVTCDQAADWVWWNTKRQFDKSGNIKTWTSSMRGQGTTWREGASGENTHAPTYILWWQQFPCLHLTSYGLKK